MELVAEIYHILLQKLLVVWIGSGRSFLRDFSKCLLKLSLEVLNFSRLIRNRLLFKEFGIVFLKLGEILKSSAEICFQAKR